MNGSGTGMHLRSRKSLYVGDDRYMRKKGMQKNFLKISVVDVVVTPHDTAKTG